MLGSLFKSVQSNFVTRPAFNLIQAANFSKYISNARKKRLPMTTKRAGKGFYKGNGCRKEGVISSKGMFRRVEGLATELVVPDLSNCPLKAYVVAATQKNMKSKVVEL